MSRYVFVCFVLFITATKYTIIFFNHKFRRVDAVQ